MSRTKQIGDASEARVLAALTASGYRVLIPWGDNAPYDFVVDTGERFVRIQVKTGRLRSGALTFTPYSVRARGRAAGAERGTYEGKIDLFMVYCPALDEVYVIPPDIGKWGPHLRVEPARNSQSKGVRLAEDYVFRGVLI